MNQSTGGGCQKSHNRACHRQQVDYHREGNTELNGAERLLRQPLQVGELRNIIAQKHDIRRVHSDVTPQAPHGDAHIGALQGRRIIDPIAYHADLPLLTFHTANPVHLIMRKQVREDMDDAGERCKVARRLAIIAGQKDDADFHFLQLLHNGAGLRLHHIGQPQKPDDLPLQSQEHHRFALILPSLDLRFLFCGNRKSFLLHERQTSTGHAPLLGSRLNAAARCHAEIRNLFRQNPLSQCIATNRLAQRMLTPSLHRSRQLQQFLFRNRWTERNHAGHLRLAVGQCAGLIESNSIYIPQLL